MSELGFVFGCINVKGYIEIFILYVLLFIVVINIFWKMYE